MSKFPEIRNAVQDRTSEAWQKVCAYVDELAASGRDEFSPAEYLGPDLYAELLELPESIGKLTKVKKFWLYGSKVRRIPPQIGEMESLKYLDVYTSYDLRWLPYEINRCRKLEETRVSTRALFGNYKNNKPFPDLSDNPVRYHGEHLECSVCREPLRYEATDQLWLTLRIATDSLPLLANVCSPLCKTKLPSPPAGYCPHPHKGGNSVKWPKKNEFDLMVEKARKRAANESAELTPAQVDSEKRKPTLLGAIRKIWENPNQ